MPQGPGSEILGVLTFVGSILLVVLAIMAFFMPFYIYQIRNYLKSIDSKMTGLNSKMTNLISATAAVSGTKGIKGCSHCWAENSTAAAVCSECGKKF